MSAAKTAAPTAAPLAIVIAVAIVAAVTVAIIAAIALFGSPAAPAAAAEAPKGVGNVYDPSLVGVQLPTLDLP